MVDGYGALNGRNHLTVRPKYLQLPILSRSALRHIQDTLYPIYFLAPSLMRVSSANGICV